MWALIILIISIAITVKTCKIMNQNTIGTTQAYLKRGFLVWAVVFFTLLGIWGKITGQL